MLLEKNDFWRYVVFIGQRRYAFLSCEYNGSQIFSKQEVQLKYCNMQPLGVSHQSSELSRLKLCVSARSGLGNGHSSGGSERFFFWPIVPGDSSSKRPIKHHPAHTYTHIGFHVTSLSV